MNSFNYIINLFKSAARDLPKIYPEWVREHDEIRKIKELSSFEKSIPIENYRETLPNKFTTEELYKLIKRGRIEDSDILARVINFALKKFIEEIGKTPSDSQGKKIIDAYKEIASKLVEESSSVGEEFAKDYDAKIKEAARSINKIYQIKNSISARYEKETPVGPRTQTINIAAGTSFVTALATVINGFKKIVESPHIQNQSYVTTMSALQDSISYKSLAYKLSDKYEKEIYDLSEGELEIVFSKNPIDILSMSSRSDWTSCQDIFRKEREPEVGLRDRAIHAAVSKFVGIIYLTNKKDYEGRGEEMIGRSLVFCLQHPFDENEQVISVAKSYTNIDRIKVEEIFDESIKRHSPIPVVGPDELRSIGGNYFLPVESRTSIPYFDSAQHKGMIRGKKKIKVVDNNRSIVDKVEQEELDNMWDMIDGI